MKTILLSLTICLLLSAAQTQKPANSKLSGKIDYTTYSQPKEIKHSDSLGEYDSQTNGIYNYKFSVDGNMTDKKINIFLNGNFDKIYRYDSLYFDGDVLDSNSEKTLEKIMKKIHDYTDKELREVFVTVISFTQKVENPSQDVSLESAYTNFFQKVAQRDDLNPDTAEEEAVDYLHIVSQKMLDNNISDSIIYKESRVGKDNLYTEEFSEGRKKNNRVDVAIYVKELQDPDSDGDGVRDSKDYCPKTPVGASVDKNGCPFVMRLDIKFDFDKATISDEVSLQNIKKLSDFMRKYPAYHANIVGHTDSTGAASYNMKLSKKRAEMVKKLLEKDGIESSRLSFEGRGESEPLFENINPFNRHQNRRTDVELTLPAPKKTSTAPKPRRRTTKE